MRVRNQGREEKKDDKKLSQKELRHKKEGAGRRRNSCTRVSERGRRRMEEGVREGEKREGRKRDATCAPRLALGGTWGFEKLVKFF